MSRLYFANPTGQLHRYYYRVDFNERGEFDEDMRRRSLRYVQVESGKQGTIELKHISQFQSVMDQMAAIGGMGIEQMSRLPNQTVPVILSIDKPVSAKIIRDVNMHNKGVMTEDGRKRRATAAISASELVKASVEATLKKFEVEFEQIDDPNEPPREGKPLAQGIEVQQPDPPKTGSSRRGRRARIGG